MLKREAIQKEGRTSSNQEEGVGGEEVEVGEGEWEKMKTARQNAQGAAVWLLLGRERRARESLPAVSDVLALCALQMWKSWWRLERAFCAQARAMASRIGASAWHELTRPYTAISPGEVDGRVYDSSE